MNRKLLLKQKELAASLDLTGQHVDIESLSNSPNQELIDKLNFPLPKNYKKFVDKYFKKDQ